MAKDASGFVGVDDYAVNSPETLRQVGEVLAAGFYWNPDQTDELTQEERLRIAMHEREHLKAHCTRVAALDYRNILGDLIKFVNGKEPRRRPVDPSLLTQLVLR